MQGIQLGIDASRLDLAKLGRGLGTLREDWAHGQNTMAALILNLTMQISTLQDTVTELSAKLGRERSLEVSRKSAGGGGHWRQPTLQIGRAS